MKTVAIADDKGRWVLSGNNKPSRPERNNFIIKSHYGEHDWSGYRTFEKCLEQVMPPSRPEGFFIVVEDC
jgi:hypothetical protein